MHMYKFMLNITLALHLVLQSKSFPELFHSRSQLRLWERLPVGYASPQAQMYQSAGLREHQRKHPTKAEVCLRHQRQQYLLPSRYLQAGQRPLTVSAHTDTQAWNASERAVSCAQVSLCSSWYSTVQCTLEMHHGHCTSHVKTIYPTWIYPWCMCMHTGVNL